MEILLYNHNDKQIIKTDYETFNETMVFEDSVTLSNGEVSKEFTIDKGVIFYIHNPFTLFDSEEVHLYAMDIAEAITEDGYDLNDPDHRTEFFDIFNEIVSNSNQYLHAESVEEFLDYSMFDILVSLEASVMDMPEEMLHDLLTKYLYEEFEL